ncbi:MAG: phosphoribosylformylglycinamidine synthase [Lentisphaeria bacterium]|nr:phosphoribosylformylglycinamidine synthase [Lentisphaeria bacterium]
MDYRIEMMVKPQWHDARGAAVLEKIRNFFKKEVQDLRTRDVFTVSADITAEQADQIGHELSNPVLQNYLVGESALPEGVNYVVAVGFRPGVTDNVARTAREAIGDIIGRRLAAGEDAYSSVEYLFTAPALSMADITEIADGLLANKLIETVSVLTADDVKKNGMPLNKPVVNGLGGGEVRTINLSVSDDELVNISKKGTLALTLEEMKSIQNYFHSAENREKYGLTKEPTDVELEVLAQTWSEHCKHKIFSAEVEYTDEEGKKETFVSLYKTFIKNGTKEVAKKIDWLVSVFTDNAGVIRFNDKFDLAYKVETHNSPSALDPYGGAMTGIVGVNRDPMGTGQGANLLLNVWGYCLGSPFTDPEDVPEGLLHPRRLRDGVHKGVIDGGNQSGIPYASGWERFDKRYIGKPLVYCGTLGTIPRKCGKVDGWTKTIKPGDLIVMAGGRIGKDGIHGATFSSEELHKDSPVQAVQIGDPITQKKMSDFMYEIRDKNLYRFVTDNGAGGLSSSVGEMAEVCNGCVMDLAKAPLKYAGMNPWEILVSEAQERMSFAVPPENIDEFLAAAKARDVEATVLGEFTDDGLFRMLYNDKTVACIEIKFMHEGLPQMKLKAKWQPPKFDEPCLKDRNLKDDVVKILGDLNICSCEYKARQYDHEVKGLSVIKPYTGVKRDVMQDATVYMAEPLGKEGIVLTSGMLPSYSDIDTYHMMASSMDLAIRQAVAVGARPDHIAGLDNFCWPDPVQSEKTPDGEYKMAQLVRANKALYDYAIAFSVPCVSGKDSMKNDSTRGGKKISIPPSVLFSVMGKMDDVSKARSLDAKFAGDAICVIGDTKKELGGSEYFNMLGYVGNDVPKVDAELANKTYKAFHEAIESGILHSSMSPALGGLAVAFSKMAMGGRLGAKIDLNAIPKQGELSDIETLFSESNTRFVVTCAKEDVAKLAKIFEGLPFAQVGETTADQNLVLGDVSIPLDEMVKSYKTTLDHI